MLKHRPVKRSVSELWDEFQSSRLRSVHLDETHSLVMRFCYMGGIRDFLIECERIGRAQPGDSNAVSAYIVRCQKAVEEEDFKARQRIRRDGLYEKGWSVE